MKAANPHPNCARVGCGHPWMVHAPEGKCRMTGCLCLAYIDKPVQEEAAFLDRARTFEEAGERVQRGDIVILAPVHPDVPFDASSLALGLVRTFLGLPLETDPQVAIVVVQLGKPE